MSSGFDRNQFRRSGAPYHGNSGARSGVVQARSVPKPVQTCSLKAENGGQDINFNLVHRGRVGWGTSSPDSAEKPAPEPNAEPASVETSGKRHVPWGAHRPPDVVPQSTPAEVQHPSPPRPSRWENVHIDRDGESYREERQSYGHNSHYVDCSPQRDRYAPSHSSRPYEVSRYGRCHKEEQRWKDDDYQHRPRCSFDHPDTTSHEYSERGRDDRQWPSRFRNENESGGYGRSSQSRLGERSSWDDGHSHHHQPPAQSEETIILQAIRERDAAEERLRIRKAKEEAASHRFNDHVGWKGASLQTSGEPSGAPVQTTAPGEKKGDHDDAAPSQSEKISTQPNVPPCKEGVHEEQTTRPPTTSVFEEEELDEEEKERLRLTLAIEQQQKILRQVQAARAARGSRKKEVFATAKDDHGGKIAPKPHWRQSSEDDATRQARHEYTRTRGARTKGLLFLRLPDGSLKRVNSCERDGPHPECNQTLSQDEEENTTAADAQEMPPDEPGQDDVQKDANPAVSVWNSGPPPSIMPAHTDPMEPVPSMGKSENHMSLGSSLHDVVGEHGGAETKQENWHDTTMYATTPTVEPWKPFIDTAPCTDWNQGNPTANLPGSLSHDSESRDHELHCDASTPHRTVPQRQDDGRKYNRAKNSRRFHGRKYHPQKGKNTKSCDPADVGDGSMFRSERRETTKGPSTDPGKSEGNSHRKRYINTRKNADNQGRASRANGRGGKVDGGKKRAEHKPRKPRKHQVVASDA